MKILERFFEKNKRGIMVKPFLVDNEWLSVKMEVEILKEFGDECLIKVTKIFGDFETEDFSDSFFKRRFKRKTDEIQNIKDIKILQEC
jgi:hypothetical protein